MIDYNELYKIYPLFSKKNLLIGEKAIEGKEFGNWTVLYRTENFTNNRHPRYVCQCKCSKIKVVSKDNLIRGRSKSCGNCSKIELNNNDKRLKHNMSENSKIIKTKTALMVNDKNYKPKKNEKKDNWLKMASKSEKIIFETLEHYGVDFIPHYMIILDNGHRVFFDFLINDKYIIEFDGEQHFRESLYGNLEKTHNKDLMKNQYCFKNNIPLIRIPHNIEWNYKDLFPETTRFLLTQENEKQYYQSRMELD